MLQNVSSHDEIEEWKALMTGVVSSRTWNTGLPEYIGKEVAPMTAYEIITILLEVLALLISSCSLMVAFLAFLDKKRNKKK